MEYKDFIDFSPLKKTLIERNMSVRDLAESAGIQDYVISNYFGGRTLPDTEKLAKMCAALQCSADKVVRFTGYEVKDRFKAPWDKYGCPRWGKLTYEPLRMLFIEVYNDGWMDKLTEFYEQVPRPELTEAQKVRAEKMVKAREALTQKRIDNGEYKGYKNTHKFRVGLSYETRTKISLNRAIPLPRLYDICKALKCTPDWVVTYN